MDEVHLGRYEHLYEGLLIVGVGSNAFGRDMHDLHDPLARYWVVCDNDDTIVKAMMGDVRSRGAEIQWPSRRSDARLAFVKFIGEEASQSTAGFRASLPEVDNRLRMKRLISYSLESPVTTP